MAADSRLWADKLSELRLWLQRSFWKPLRGTMEIFHVLPLAATVILFALLATNGQYHEIYVSYLEGPGGDLGGWSARIVAGLASLALISAALFYAHNTLSTMRINVVFSNRSDPEAYSALPRLQRAAAFILAFMPWLGLASGLFGARNFVVARYCQLLDVARVDADTLGGMQYLPQANGVEIAAAAIVLGGAAAFFVCIDDRNRAAQWAVGCFAPGLLILFFLLGSDWFDLDPLKWLTTAQVWKSVGLGALVVTATAIYLFIYRELYHRRSAFLFSNLTVRTGVSFRKRRRWRLALWTFLPWLAFALFFLLSDLLFNRAEAANGCRSVSFASVPTPGRWAIFPVAMACSIAIGLLVGYFLLWIGSTNRPRNVVSAVVIVLVAAVAALALYNDAGLIVSIYRFIGPFATASLVLTFLFATFAVLAWLSQQSGFPALTLIVLTMIVCAVFPSYAWLTTLALGVAYSLFAGIALLSGRVQAFLVLLVLIIVGVINVMRFNEGASVPPNPPLNKVTTAASSAPSAPTVQAAYLCWLDQRGVPAKRLDAQTACPDRPPQVPALQGKYPVFVFAAEGGGIYAASAAAAFLAKLEDDQRGLARHIFAISGVSGGAIGATVFGALDRTRYADPHSAASPSATDRVPKASAGSDTRGEEKCTRHPADNTEPDLVGEIAKIMLDDHLSPVVGSIFPEIFGAPLRRPDALRASFEYSTFRQSAAAGDELCGHFLAHWPPVGTAPALVLNSTWVETGFRVAFAPFLLHDLDDSLYSFLDSSMPNENCPNNDDTQSCVSLMTAAIVSARFPGMMPPFSAIVQTPKHHDAGQRDGERRWNFVDGGYADNSGATTALDIYRTLNSLTAQLKMADDVDLRIVLITSSSLQPNLDDLSINGTVFRDTVAPIDAILRVRENLGNQAVARACSEIYPDQTQPNGAMREPNESCIRHAGVRNDSPLQIIEIQDQTYGLSLGWKISQTSFAVIKWMLSMFAKTATCSKNLPSLQSAGGSTPKQDAHASQENTPVPSGESPNAQLTNGILRRNSCVARLLIDLVRDSGGGTSGR
jgi:hypothetical protein